MDPDAPTASFDAARRFERVALRLWCWCEAERLSLRARVSNVSEGGLLLRTPMRLPPGLRLRISLAALGGVTSLARVVWARLEHELLLPGAGLEFSEEDERRLVLLKRLVLAQRR